MYIWMLNFNDDKTEALLFPYSSSLRPSTVSLSDSITLGSHTSASLILPGTLESFLTQTCSWRNTSETEFAKLIILSLNALVRSAGFSLKMQPTLLLPPISSHGSTTATVPSRVHLILSFNRSRNSKLCCRTRSFGTPPPALNTYPGKTALASHFRTY